ncbi:MAG TPA: hypothetical protein VG102_02145 [Candidatus Paceibacterota bacterium]|nr:hypothetical protein [Candidatus Paceibacterota bacterium]
MKTGITVMIAAISALGGSSFLSGHVPFVSGYAAPAQCVEWYDGCNMCDRTPSGAVSCTDRVCTSSGKGFCRQYATSTAETK